ncbi:MAG: acetolactate synthase small subunit [Actinomycetia bacterium]|nr:acetolactate synthase small subunit [Actinomycetes bacterium]
MSPEARHQVLSVLVENRSGVLARIAGLFARRGYNIYSLAVAPTDDDRFSRITIVVDVESAPLEQIVKQLNKLVNVIKISELDPRDSIERELMLLTVKAAPGSRGEILELVGLFDADVIDVGADELTVSLDDVPGRLDDLEALLRPYGIVDIQRTGRVALPRLERSAGAPGLRSAG